MNFCAMFCSVGKSNKLKQLFLQSRGAEHLKDFVRFKSVKKKLRENAAREENIIQYAGKHNKRADRVYVWGFAATGALGVERFIQPKNNIPRDTQYTPHRHSFWERHRIKVLDVACGYGFTLFLGESQNKHVVYGTGVNTDSQLGYHKANKKGESLEFLIEPQPLPVTYSDDYKITHIACGRGHTVIVRDNNEVFSLGNNSNGQCGRPIVDGEIFKGSQIVNTFQLDFNVKQIECGQDHTLFLSEDGQVYACGLGADGQTGQGHFESVSKVKPVVGDVQGEQITQLSSKGDTVLAISDKGEVFGWGSNEYNQFSMIDVDTTQLSVARHLPMSDVGSVTDIAAAGATCAVLNDNGEVFTWGFGILGRGPKAEECSYPTLLPATLFGRNEFNTNINVKSLSCGLHHFAAVNSEGSLFVWGKNRSGILGLGHKKDQFFPFKVQVPAEVNRVICGVDHTVTLSKAYF